MLARLFGKKSTASSSASASTSVSTTNGTPSLICDSKTSSTPGALTGTGSGSTSLSTIQMQQEMKQVPLHERSVKLKIEHWMEQLNDVKLLPKSEQPSPTKIETPTLYYDRSLFGRYDTFGYRFYAISLEQLEKIPESIDNLISKIQIHILSGQQDQVPFLQVSWSPSMISPMTEDVSKSDLLVRKLGRLTKVPVPLLDKLIEIDYSKSELDSKTDDTGSSDVAFQASELQSADKTQIRHMTSLLYKLQGQQTPQTLKFVLICIRRKPLMFRIRCWGFQTLLVEHLRLLAQIFPSTIEHVWVDFTRRTLCIDFRSQSEPIETVWFQSGIHNTTIDELTPSSLLLPPYHTMVKSTSASSASDSTMEKKDSKMDEAEDHPSLGLPSLGSVIFERPSKKRRADDKILPYAL